MTSKLAKAALGLLLALWVLSACLPAPAWAKTFEPQGGSTPGAAVTADEVAGVEGDAAAPDAAGTPDAADAAVSLEGFVFDEYGLFSADQLAQLEQQAQTLADDYGLGVYLLTCDTMDGYPNPTSSQRTTFATSFYRNHDLGLGQGKDGIMLALAVESRDYVTIAYGQGSYDFNDDGIEAMEEAVTDPLADDQWFEAAEAYYDQIGRQLAYHSRTGRTAQPVDGFGWLIRIGLILGIPLVLAFGMVGMERSAMKTARQREEAHEYLDPQSLVLTESSDTFVNTTMAVTPRVQSSGSGGGGGGWGGGGGGFSSSGGGKF